MKMFKNVGSALAFELADSLCCLVKERAIRPVAEAVNPNLRQALVIGNSEYEHAGRLRNPVNDAKELKHSAAVGLPSDFIDGC